MRGCEEDIESARWTLHMQGLNWRCWFSKVVSMIAVIFCVFRFDPYHIKMLDGSQKTGASRFCTRMDVVINSAIMTC